MLHSNNPLVTMLNSPGYSEHEAVDFLFRSFKKKLLSPKVRALDDFVLGVFYIFNYYFCFIAGDSRLSLKRLTEEDFFKLVFDILRPPE